MTLHRPSAHFESSSITVLQFDGIRFMQLIEPHQITKQPCKISGFRGGVYEDVHLLNGRTTALFTHSPHDGGSNRLRKIVNFCQTTRRTGPEDGHFQHTNRSIYFYAEFLKHDSYVLYIRQQRLNIISQSTISIFFSFRYEINSIQIEVEFVYTIVSLCTAPCHQRNLYLGGAAAVFTCLKGKGSMLQFGGGEGGNLGECSGQLSLVQPLPFN